MIPALLKKYLWIIVTFLSVVWTLILTAPIPAEHPLTSKSRNAKFLQICFDEFAFILDVNFQQISIFGWTSSFKIKS